MEIKLKKADNAMFASDKCIDTDLIEILQKVTPSLHDSTPY